MTKEEMARFLYEALCAENRDPEGIVAVPEGPISKTIAWDCVTARGVFDFLAIAEAILALPRT